MQWFEDEALWTHFYPYLFDERRFAAAGEEVDRLIAMTGVTSGAALDLCCGPGRHAVALARKGFTVTAVDRSAFLLGKAGQHAAGIPIEFVQADMREFERENTFDLALNLFSSFGYFNGEQEDLTVLENVHKSLKSGGIFVIDLLGKELVAARPCATHWQDGPGGEIFIDHHEVLPGWARLRIRWLLVQKEQTRHFELELKAYSGEELRQLLEQAGFCGVRLFGSLDGKQYDRSATRLVAMARR